MFKRTLIFASVISLISCAKAKNSVDSEMHSADAVSVFSTAGCEKISNAQRNVEKTMSAFSAKMLTVAKDTLVTSLSEYKAAANALSYYAQNVRNSKNNYEKALHRMRELEKQGKTSDAQAYAYELQSREAEIDRLSCGIGDVFGSKASEVAALDDGKVGIGLSALVLFVGGTAAKKNASQIAGLLQPTEYLLKRSGQTIRSQGVVTWLKQSAGLAKAKGSFKFQKLSWSKTAVIRGAATKIALAAAVFDISYSLTRMLMEYGGWDESVQATMFEHFRAGQNDEDVEDSEVFAAKTLSGIIQLFNNSAFASPMEHQTVEKLHIGNCAEEKLRYTFEPQGGDEGVILRNKPISTKAGSAGDTYEETYPRCVKVCLVEVLPVFAKIRYNSIKHNQEAEMYIDRNLLKYANEASYCSPAR